MLAGRLRRAVGEPIQAIYFRRTAQCYQRHFLVIARFEADSGSRRNVESHSESLRPIEPQTPIDLEEMEMGTYLNRAVAGVGNFQFHGPAAGIRRNGIRREKIFTRNHWSSLVVRPLPALTNRFNESDDARSQAWYRRGRFPPPARPRSFPARLPSHLPGAES